MYNAPINVNLQGDGRQPQDSAIGDLPHLQNSNRAPQGVGQSEKWKIHVRNKKNYPRGSSALGEDF